VPGAALVAFVSLASPSADSRPPPYSVLEATLSLLQIFAMWEVPPDDDKSRSKQKPAPRPRAEERPRYSEERERRQARLAMLACNRAREGTDKMSHNSSCGSIIVTIFLVAVFVAIFI
jgi:hypothetical protein